MRKMVLLYIAIVVIVAVVGIYAIQSKQAGEDNMDIQGIVQKLCSQDIIQRKKAYEQILNQRTELLHVLLRIAATEKSSYDELDERYLAVLLLGEMRAPEAVDILIRGITFSPPGMITREDSPIAPYPCVGALIKIGEPAVRAILERIHQVQDKDTLTLYVLVIQMVECSREVAVFKIRKSLKEAFGGRKKYLEALLAECQKRRFVGD